MVVRDPARLVGDAIAVTLDGLELDGTTVRLIDDGATHRVVIEPRGHESQTESAGERIDRSDGEKRG